MLARAVKFVGWAIWGTVKVGFTTVILTVVLWGMLYVVLWGFDL